MKDFENRVTDPQRRTHSLEPVLLPRTASGPLAFRELERTTAVAGVTHAAAPRNYCLIGGVRGSVAIGTCPSWIRIPSMRIMCYHEVNRSGIAVALRTVPFPIPRSCIPFPFGVPFGASSHHLT